MVHLGTRQLFTVITIDSITAWPDFWYGHAAAAGAHWRQRFDYMYYCSACAEPAITCELPPTALGMCPAS
jgi:hypothetical protein